MEEGTKTTMEINEMLFGYGKREVSCIAGTSKPYVGMTGPAGVGMSKARPASAKKGAKLNGMIVVLDNLFKKQIATIVGEFAVTEYKYDKKDILSTFNGSELSFSGKEIIEDYEILTPIVMWGLGDECDAPEFKERMEDAVQSYISDGTISFAQAYGLCDSFYYEVCLQYGDTPINIFTDDVMAETFKQGYVAEVFQEIDELEGLDCPDMKLLDGVKRTRAKSKRTISMTFEACKNGEHIIPYDWSDDQKEKIPDLETLEDFIPNDTYYSMLRKIEHRSSKILDRMNMGKNGIRAIGDDYINALMVGKPGTGKTTVAYALGATTGLPVYTIPITKNTEEDTFQGQTKVVNGKFDFVSTDFLKAFTEGGIIVLEEINLADPAVIMGTLGQAIEFPFVLMRDGYESVTRHPMCFIIGTMNVGTAGSKDISEALSSRFKQTYVLDDPTEEQFIDILKKKSDLKDPKIFKWIYDSFQKILNYLESPSVNQEELCLMVTLRGCIGALQNMEEGEPPKMALQNTLCGKIAERDLFLANNLNKDVISILPNISVA